MTDLQPKPSSDIWRDKRGNKDWLWSFSPKSNTIYTVTVGIRNSAGDMIKEPIEIKEWSNIVNQLSQHGLETRLVTLKFPSTYLALIEEAAKCEGELVVTIDDSRIESSGDSYVIDYAELFVNTELKQTGEISGTVKDADTKNPIEGVWVTNLSTGQSVKTDKDGNYCFTELIPGQVVLHLSHPAYIDRDYTIDNVKAGENRGITIEMVKDTNATIPIAEKMEGTLFINRLDASGNTLESKSYPFTIKGKDDIVYISHENIKVEPNESYKVTYQLNLKSASEVDPYASDFTLTFDSQISVKLTQENNSGWNEDGTD